MKIIKLVIKDFRCFEAFEIKFSEAHNMHVIVAENMVGKSALLAALRLAVNTYTSGLKTERQILISDHRIIGTNPIADISPDVSLVTTAIVDGTLSVWRKYKLKPRGDKTKIRIEQGLDPRKVCLEQNRLVGEGQGMQALFAYIGTEYIHVESSETVMWEVDGKSIDGYKGCFEDKSVKKFLFNWLGRMDRLILEVERKSIMADSYKDIPSNAMAVFQKTVMSVLPDITAIQWNADTKQPMVKLKNGDIRLFDMLSDGYRYLILLAGELATRAFILNKHLGLSVAEHINGVVIIDEFGIHLHPSLQKDALIRLQQTFPNVQFIVSTHSPLLLNGLKKEQIHILSIDKDGKRIVSHPEEDVVGLGANEILTSIFGLATTMDDQFIEWNRRYIELFEKKKQGAISEEELLDLTRLSKLLSPLRLDPSLVITTDDTITSIVKEQLANRVGLKDAKIDELSSEDLKSKVSFILNDLFTPNAPA